MSKKLRSLRPAVTPPQTSERSVRPWGRALALACGLVPSLLALAQFPFINGTPYWPWRYYDGQPALFAAIALVVWAALYWADQRVSRGGSTRGPLLLLAVLHVGLIVSYTALSEKGLGIVGERVRHPDITSYHTEAARIDAVSFDAVRSWLADYPQRLGGMIGHAQTHPPGPILYYALWNAPLGPEAGAQWGGMFLALLGGLAIPLLHGLVRRVSGSELAGFAGAAAWTPLPAIVAMLGSLDAVYPLFTLGLCLLWIGACWDGSRAAAAGFGALLFVALLFTTGCSRWGLLCLLGWRRSPSGSARAACSLAAASAIGGGAAVGLFVLLWLTTGYDHLAALLASMRIQEGLAGAWNRPWRLTVLWDIYDFFLASGWATFGFVALFVTRLPRSERSDWRVRSFAAAALGTILIVDVSGLLRAETARVWLFLQPLALGLVGLELARWSSGWRAAAYAVLLFALVAIRSRMTFL